MSDGPSRHRILRASAGTGKTYQLVETYVAQICKRGLRPGQVVAITFTRKAAAELRQRIRARLRQEGMGHQQLTELSRAPISNFHGLALQLLRGFGFRADFPEGAEVLGQQGDDRALFLDACEEAWFGTAAQVTHAVEQLAPYFSVDVALPAALWDALSRTREDGVSLLGEALIGHYDPAACQQQVHAELGALRRRLIESLPTLTEKARAAVDGFLAEPPADPSAPPDAWAAAWQNAGRHLHRRGKLGKVFTVEDQALIKADVLLPAAEDACASLGGHLAQLLDAAWATYQDKKRLRRAVDFGDLVERLVTLLEQRPELHHEVRQRYAAVLVDEAQDTNRLQRRMVRLLAGLEGPAAAETSPAGLFVVGDWKQSIYTFRGADPASFSAFARDVVELGGDDQVLEVSRRSCPELVAAINDLGETLFAEAYEPLAPLQPSETGAGRASAPLGRPAMTWLDLPADTDGPQAAIEEAGAVAGYVQQRLSDGTAPGEMAVLLATMTRAPLFAAALADLGIPAVLGGGGGLYEQCEVVDVLALLGWLIDPEDRLSAAIALRSPLVGLSDPTLLDLFARDERGSESRLDALRAGRAPSAAALDGSVAAAQDAAALERLAEALPDLVAAARVMPAAALLAYAEKLVDWRPVYLALDNGEQRLANLDRLTQLAADHDRAERGSAARFVREQLERVRSRHAEPVAAVPAAARRAVTLSSVHQSKGLQYPVVLLADLARRGRDDFSSLRHSPEGGVVFLPRRGQQRLASRRWQQAVDSKRQGGAEELKRLLYVAVTRAEQEVVCFGRVGSKPSKHGFAQHLVPWLPQAACRGVLHRAPAPAPRPPAPAPPPCEPGAEELAWAEQLVGQTDERHAPPGSRFDLPVTTLETYAQCLRRGLFAHELRLPENPHVTPRLRELPDDDRQPPLDPLARGRVAHLVLAGIERCRQHPSADAFVEAEIRSAGYDPGDPHMVEVKQDVLAFVDSPLGRRLARLDADQRRPEMPFQLGVDADPYVAVLHGQIDLLYWDEPPADEGTTSGGPVVVDYKHAHATQSGLAAYATQLDAYAVAAARLCGVDGPVRTRLVFLRDRCPPHERIVSVEMQQALCDTVRDVAQELAHRGLGHESWPGLPLQRCLQLKCGHAPRCHGPQTED